MESFASFNDITAKSNEPENILLKIIFNWLPTSMIKKTFQLYIQNSCTPTSSFLRKTHRSPFPTLAESLQFKPVATNIIYCNEPAERDGSTWAQLFTGTKALATDACGMKSDQTYVNTLEKRQEKRIYRQAHSRECLVRGLWWIQVHTAFTLHWWL